MKNLLLLFLFFVGMTNVALAQAPASLPLNFDDDAAITNYDLIPFGTGVSSGLVADPTDPSNTVLTVTKPTTAECWGGNTIAETGLASSIPFAGNRLMFTVDVYSPVAGSAILLKLETAGGGPEAQVVAFTTTADAWETLTFDFAGAGIDLNHGYNKVVIFPQFSCDGIISAQSDAPYYFDNIILLPAFGPIPVPPSIPIAFGEFGTTYNFNAFGGAQNPGIVTDPTDPGNSVLSFSVDGSTCFGGVVVGDPVLESPVPFTAGDQEMRVDVYSPVAGSVILLKLEGSGAPIEISAVTTMANAWENLVFNFAGLVNLNDTYNKVVLFPQFTCNGPSAMSSDAYLFDNIRFTTQPFLECRQPTSTVNTPGVCGATGLEVLDPFVLDPDEVGGFVLTSDAPDVYPIGTNITNFTLTNANGSMSTCQQQVIIEDDELATVGPCDSVYEFCAPNSCSAIVLIDPDIADNCGVVDIQGTGFITFPLGLHEHEIIVTDANGNVTTHILDVEIHDEFGPEFINCPEEVITLTTPNYPAGLMPFATDNCGIDEITNNIPEDGVLPTGASQVTFTAEDTYGNLTDCVIDFMVVGDEISLHPASDIGATLAEDENSQIVTWNPLNATTVCTTCEETNLEGFTFIGNYWGHQYFLADEVSLTRQDAQLIAEGYDAHLAVISDAGENNYLKEALSNEVRTAWIGLMPQNVNDTWSFVWDNDETNAFDALALDMNEVNANTRIVLSQDGNWVAATDAEEKYFLIERPCVNFTQVGPLAPSTSQLLRSGDAWPEGEYEVTYAAVDMCGNESQLSFDVNVQPEVSEFCTTAGTDNSVWIEGVTFHEMTNTSASNEGYADFAEAVTTMNIGDGVVLLDLTAGGNTADEVLYWRVWLDRNNDGDFFDANEVLFSQSTENAHLQANISLAQEAVSNARLRVAVARHAFPAPCGNPYVGEVEDYTVTLTVPTVIDIERKPQMEIFPNPASTYVNVDLSDFAGEEVSVRIIDNLGKSISFVKEVVAIKGSVRLDLRGITGGVYNISVSTNERQVTKRLVVANTSYTTAAR